MSLGQILVSHVRSAMLAKLRGQPLPEAHPVLSGMRSGVFVTVEAIVRSGGFERREVRGSLGVVEPYRDLAYDTAKIAAKLVYSIPRFTEFDLRRSVVEVTLVGALREWDGELEGFGWGREGVYAVSRRGMAVVLPQTMVERRILGDALHRYVESLVGPPERLYRFDTQIFYELHPEGEVIERELWRSRVIRQFLEVVR
ncbi:AMMECR1 domain-containing protein [Pyrobaculum neutrophilum]|uniref:AMMECR1 domain protein n=1 Tax=Pyrobaculum neutrophilum (strain DSM 2338 / JCM 9278 / NBRC 100436 / V24Sta) TaxID=444157 RepID=B1YA49_PYRNV|nr:AMMECR1 domain-containing protein [Pyrobaculum neutrophilum]ACB39023.1 AMMECR1 domain protein [Pyrobaculum neutrophilum V24Sta]